MKQLRTGNGNPPPEKPKKDPAKEPVPTTQDDTGNGNPPPDKPPK